MWSRKAVYASAVLTLILSALPAMALPAGRLADEDAAETFPPVAQPEAPPPPDQPLVLRNPFVSAAVRPHSFDGDVRKLPAPQPVSGEPREVPVSILHDPSLAGADRTQRSDELRSAGILPAAASMPPPIQNWEGQDNIDGIYPPDTVGDVGPNHYIQMVNVDNVRIWNKTGTVLASFKLSSLWPIGDTCRSDGSGDVIVLHDPIADRWLLSQFTFPPSLPYSECIAISKTSDPVAGGWWAYTFNAPDTALGPAFPDYPKLGVWPDAYYMSVNQFPDAGGWGGAGVYAYDRATMLTGAAATFQYFDLGAVDLNFGGLLPSDLDGARLPPAGSPNFFSAFDDETWGAFPFDVLHVWEYHVDWAAPANTTFTGPLELATEPFTADICDAFRRRCIPQPDMTVQLEALSDRLMHRLAYRNFGDHETLVVSHAVQTTDSAGIRWYEIRKSGTSDWSIYQQDTYAPDSHYRWMPSVAMDRSGNLGIGYSVSSSTLYPSIRYSGRLATDPLNTTPRTEQSIITGSGSQLGSSARWGDYSAMSVDPVDDCTFWYTQEYIQTTGSVSWQTRVASFKFANCTAGPTGTLTGVARAGSTNNPLANATVRVRRNATETVDTLTDADGAYLLKLPVGTYTMTASLYGYATGTIPGVTIAAGVTTTQNIMLNPAAFYVVSGTVTDSSIGWPLYANITISAEDFPGASIWTNPVTGYYSATLVEGFVHTFDVNAWAAGYDPASAAVGPLAGNTTRNFRLDAKAISCNAPGYTTSATKVYSETFEANNGRYTISGVTSWAWGAPTSGPGSAHSGVNVWATQLTGNYNDGEDGYITSPNIDLSAHAGKAIAVAWWQWLQTENRYDYASVEVSRDGGATWTRVYGEVSGDIDSAWAAHSVTVDPTYAVSNFRVRFRLRTDFSVTYPGWYVDDVSVSAITCYAKAGGLVVGNVYDDNTGAPLAGATVNGSVDSATTMATPDDPAVDDSLYTLFAPSGAQTLTATMSGGYGTVVTTTNVVVSGTVRRDFDLPAGWLNYPQASYAVTLTLGYSTTRPFTLINSGGRPVSFELMEVSGGYQTNPIGPSGPSRRPSGVNAPDSQRPIPRANQNLPSARGLGRPPAPPAPPYAAGNVIQSWTPANNPFPWGIAYDSSDQTVWVGEGWGYNHVDEYSPDGTPSGRAWPYTWIPFAGPADHAFNWLTGMLWAMDLGSDNCIHEIDPAAGVTGNTICPAFSTSQRGLAYDPSTDTWFAGSWNDQMIHHFDSTGAMLDEVNVSLDIAGLAYNAATQHLFVMVNGSPNPVYVLDAANNYSVLGQFNVSAGFGDYSGAGLEFDCLGSLWAIDQGAHTVYQFESGETASMCGVPWLSESPMTGTLPAGPASQAFTFGFDAGIVGQPGRYLAQLAIKEDTPYEVTTVPITLTVAPPATWGQVYGRVYSLGYCDASPRLATGAKIRLDYGSGLSMTLTQGQAAWSWWAPAGRVTMTASANNHVSQTLVVNAIAGVGVNQDFSLRWLHNCGGLLPAPLDFVVKANDVTTVPIMLTNGGTLPWTWALTESSSWLSISGPATGTTLPDSSLRSALSIDAAGMLPDVSYSALLKITHDDDLQTSPLMALVTVRPASKTTYLPLIRR